MAQPTAPAASYAGSESFISGYFGILDLADEMVSDLIGDIAAHIGDSEELANDQLQESAQRIPGWDELVDNLAVSVFLGKISIDSNAFGETEQQMMNLEFGTPEEPPVPFMRMSAAPVADLINSYVNSEMRKDIPLA